MMYNHKVTLYHFALWIITFKIDIIIIILFYF